MYFTEDQMREIRRRINQGVAGSRAAGATHSIPHQHPASDIIGGADLAAQNNFTGTINTFVQIQATGEISTDAGLNIGAGSISANALTSARTLTLPDRNGELMLTNDQPVSHTHAWGDMVEPIWPHLAYVEKSANYPLTSVDSVVNVTANSPTITLPTAVGSPGKLYIVRNTGAGVVTLATTSAQTIDGGAPGTVAAGAGTRLLSTGSNWITV